MRFLEVISKIPRPLVDLIAVPANVTQFRLLHVDLFIVAHDGGRLSVGSGACRAADTSIGKITEEYRT